MKCLDTDMLIAFARGVEEAVNIIKKCRDSNETIATTWINSCELLKGAYIQGEPKQIAGIRNLLNSLEILLPTVGASDLYAQLYSRLRHKGKTIGDFDLMIAVIAMENDSVLLSRDRDFEDIAGLRIEKW